jgi:hypothetical protein
MPDPCKTVRQHMKKKAPDEFIGSQIHLFLLITVSIVSPFESDHSVFKFQDTVVGDGDTVGVPSEILDHMAGVFEWGLTVDNPFLLIERRYQIVKQRLLS